MKRRYLIIFASMFLSAAAFSQQKHVVFKVKLTPALTYTSLMTTTSSSTVNFKADPKTMEQLKAAGMQIPMKVEAEQKIATTTETSAVNAANEFAFITTCNDVIVSQSINGVQQAVAPNPVAGSRTFGRILETGEMKVDSVTGDNMTDELKQVVTTITENVVDQIKFPDKPLKAGDSFTQKVPMSIPMAGMAPIQIVVTTEYRLKSLTSAKAYFDIIQDVTLSSDNKEATIAATGNGTGNSIYDVKNNFITDYHSDLTIDVAVTVNNLKIELKSRAKNSQRIIIR